LRQAVEGGRGLETVGRNEAGRRRETQLQWIHARFVSKKYRETSFFLAKRKLVPGL
jgi:hypothetical protein